MRSFLRESSINYTYNKQLDYVASCTSELHLIGTLAFLSYLRIKLKRNINGIVIICEHWSGRYLVDGNEYRPPEGLGVSYEMHLKGVQGNAAMDYLERMTKPQKADIYVISPNFQWVKMVDRCRKKTEGKVIGVVIDEGIGAYNDIISATIGDLREYRKLSNAADYFARRIASAGICHLFGAETMSFMLLRKRRCNYDINRAVAACFKKALSYSIDGNTYDLSGKYAILLTSPFEKMGDLNMDIILDIYKSLFHAMHRKGIRLNIKPHPREDVKKYCLTGIPIMENSKETIERLLQKLRVKPVAVFGAGTTALLTVPVLFGISSYSLDGIMLSKMIGDRHFRKMLKSNIKCYRGFVKVISSSMLEKI